MLLNCDNTNQICSQSAIIQNIEHVRGSSNCSISLFLVHFCRVIFLVHGYIYIHGYTYERLLPVK